LLLPPAAGGAAPVGHRKERTPDGTQTIATKRITPRNEAGTAVVELALVLPLFLLLVLGMVDFGKGFNYWIDQTHLANEAARFAVVNKNPGEAASDTLQEYIRKHANTGELANGGTNSIGDPLAVCIEFPEGDEPEAGDPVTVRVTTTYNWMPFLDVNLGFTAVKVQGTATMRLEAKPTEYDTTDNSEDC
jgi:Flp pilus assembly protein TadG